MTLLGSAAVGGARGAAYTCAGHWKGVCGAWAIVHCALNLHCTAATPHLPLALPPLARCCPAAGVPPPLLLQLLEQFQLPATLIAGGRLLVCGDDVGAVGHEAGGPALTKGQLKFVFDILG